MQKGKRKQQQQKKFDRRRQREGDFEEEAPVKKKPLLQTPMEERPVCRFFKEGKCQRVGIFLDEVLNLSLVKWLISMDFCLQLQHV